MSQGLLEDIMHNTQHINCTRNLCLAWLTMLLSIVTFANGAVAGDTSPWKLAFTLKDASLNTALPTALYVDGEKNRYYMVDSFTGRLASFDDKGSFLKSFSPEDPLRSPFDMVRLDGSTLVIAEKGTNSLTRIDFSQQKTTRMVLEDKGRQIMVDRLEISGDKLYALDRGTGQIYKLSRSLEIEQRFPLPEESKGLVDFKVVGQQIWALGQQEKRIYLYAENGRISKRIDLAHLVKFPVSLAVDGGGTIYILDRHQAQVIVLDRKTKLKYKFLSKGHGLQHLYFPIEILFDPWGRLCIVDEGNSRVQVFQR